MFERLAHFIGWTTLYHVSWTQQITNNAFQNGDMTLTVSPWITVDNWKKARNKVAEFVAIEPTEMVITSITKL